jgi:hypothetical protein
LSGIGLDIFKKHPEKLQRQASIDLTCNLKQLSRKIHEGNGISGKSAGCLSPGSFFDKALTLCLLDSLAINLFYDCCSGLRSKGIVLLIWAG